MLNLFRGYGVDGVIWLFQLSNDVIHQAAQMCRSGRIVLVGVSG